MTDFKAKMHQIRFRLGLHPDSPDSLAGFGQPWHLPFAAEGGAGLGKRKERGGEGNGGPQVTVEPGPLRALLRHCTQN